MAAAPAPAAAAHAAAPGAAAPAASPWPAFLVASCATFLVSLDTTMLYAAFDALRRSFDGASAADLSWVLNGYTVVYAAMLIPAGGLSDTYGRRRIFRLGVTLFVLASIACGAAPTVGTLVAARVLQALGAALLTPASMSIVLAAFPAERRAVAVSLWGAVGGLAAAVGPSLGSWVTAKAGWPWAFWINVPVGLWALWRSGAHVVEAARPEQRRRIDVVGLLLLMGAVGALALALVESGSPDWSRERIAGVAATGLLAGLAFVPWARRRPDPLVDLALFRHPTYRWINVATLAFGTTFAMMFLGFFMFLTGVWHYSLPQAGIAVTPGPLLVVPTAIVTGRFAARLGHRPFLIGGSLLFAACSLWMLVVPGTEPDYLRQWLPALLASGVAVGLVLPSLSAAAVARLPGEHYAVGSAVNQATRQIGSVLGVAITVALLGHASVTRADFDAQYLLQAALALVTALACLPVNTRPR